MRSIFLIIGLLALGACASGVQVAGPVASLTQSDVCSGPGLLPGEEYAECDPIFDYHTGE